MNDMTRRNAFRLFGAALLGGVVAMSGEAEAQPYYDPYDRPPPRRRPPPPPPYGYGPPPRRRCWWRETPWGPRKVCR